MNRTRWWLVLALVAICAAYANHFQNSFHFDDSHTIVDNPYIRNLANIPSFFTDANTFSILPANRSWRPLTSTSLAIDYWLGGGLTPAAFQTSTFLWFLLLVWILYRFAERIFDTARPGVDNSLPAAFAAAWFGLHPVCAETVNYAIQRADVYSTLGAMASIYMYARYPDWRKFGLYLLPAVAAQLSKQSALISPLLLILYLALIEKKPIREAARQAIPAVAATLVLVFLNARMIPATFNPGTIPPFQYRITQPYVIWHYFQSFFLPLGLTADSDMTAFASLFDPLALYGVLFLAALIAGAVYCGRRPRLAPVAFGLWWFLVTLAPTSLFTLAEVENDHRMFFPFIGLTIAVVWAIVLVWPAAQNRLVTAGAACLLLAACAWGVHERNEVWRNEATLWKDVTIKSPRNGRGLMNYGLSLMAAGDSAGALGYFQRALPFTPNYYVLEINLGIALGELRRDAEAETHFVRAVALAPKESIPYHFYGRWLNARNRKADARFNLRKAMELNPADPRSRELLQQMDSEVIAAEKTVTSHPSADAYLNLSLRYHQAGRFTDTIRVAREALTHYPDLAEAYNNIAAAHEELKEWDEAIEAATQALKRKPDFALARNNLAWSLSQKALAAKKQH